MPKRPMRKNPAPRLPWRLRRAYQKLGNDAKYNQWREKVLAQDPDNIEILIDMTQTVPGKQ